jgi:hypothetical protein
MLQTPGNASASGTLHAILSSVNVCSIVLATGIMSLSGCDPVRTIRHHVTMEVKDDHGLPAADVKVSMKESWESWQTWGGGTPESEKSYFRQRWQSEPWLKGVTDAQGKVVIEIQIAGLDWTKGNEPPATRDFVSNREHIIRLKGPKGQDELRVVMKPDAVAAGKRYTVRIEAIEKPRYVQSLGEEKGGTQKTPDKCGNE